MSKIYELGLAQGYVRRWGLKEAVRELLQNAIDSDAPFEYYFSATALEIVSRDITLSARQLLLGATSKADNKETIGSFGEGFKLAMLVLTREGYDVTCHNGDLDWIPSFEHSDTFGDECLFITETEADNGSRDLIFVIDGLGAGDMQAIRDSCLHMQDEIADAIQTSKGRILPSRPGKLYVNGLFVCDTKLTYGYDFKPAHITLERDRQTVDGFRVQWAAKDMWHETKQWDLIAELTEKEVPDFEYAQHGAPADLTEACRKRFAGSNGNALIARTEPEARQLKSRGAERVAFTPSASYHAMVSSAASYKVVEKKLEKAKTPVEVIDDWYKANKKFMPNFSRSAFDKLREQAADWKVGGESNDVWF